MTLASLAGLAKITPTSLSLLERDRRTPSRELLFRLADILHVSVQFIEKGELTTEDQAKIARHALWPEIVYIIANHLVVPREIDPIKVSPDNDGMRAAIDRAFDAPHFCEYRSWAESFKGQKIASLFRGNWVIEELIERVAGKQNLKLPTSWIGIGDHLDTNRKISPKHHSAVDFHIIIDHPADCFLSDLRTTYKLYRKLPFLWGYPGEYKRDAFAEPFVENAFPAIFWSAARLWSDRRLAGWLWYLDMPLDLFGPLARLARQYDTADDFAANAKRLLDQATLEDRDVFLGLFPDIMGEQALYTKRFGTVGFIGGVIRVNQIYGAFIDVYNRRETRKTRLARDLLDLVATMGDDQKLKRCEQALRKIAPPFNDPPMGMLMANSMVKRTRRKVAREDDRPPETLP